MLLRYQGPVDQGGVDLWVDTKEMQAKTNLRFHLTPARMMRSKIQVTQNWPITLFYYLKCILKCNVERKKSSTSITCYNHLFA